MFSKLKVLLLAFMVILPFNEVYGQERIEPSGEKSTSEFIEEVQYRLDTNRHFLQAVHTIVGESDHQEAKRFLKLAESTTAEAVNHYEAGLYDRAMEDLSESTQMAIHAIILVKGEASSTREFIIQEEYARNRREEREKKVALINRRTIETRTFIRTAERMLGEGRSKGGRDLLEDAKNSLGLALASLKQGFYDEALSNINEAYTLATGSVREISRARGRAIVFPKPSADSQEELFSYELKHNGTYLFFASGVVKSDKGDAGRALKEGRTMRRKAIQLMEDGKTKEAIEMLKSSTELITEAINMAVQPNPCSPEKYD
jgi:HEPN domain-containing protein